MKLPDKETYPGSSRDWLEHCVRLIAEKVE